MGSEVTRLPVQCACSSKEARRPSHVDVKANDDAKYETFARKKERNNKS